MTKANAVSGPATERLGALKKGTRVSAIVYGVERTGELIADQRSSIVWVRWYDGKAPAGIVTWMHPESLTLESAQVSK